MHRALGPALIGLSMFAAVACGPKTGAPPGAVTPNEVNAARAKWADTNEAEIALGHDTFLANCNRCHGYPDRAAVSEKEWPSIIAEMGKKAKLDPKQTQAVLRFVLASRTTEAPSPAAAP